MEITPSGTRSGQSPGGTASVKAAKASEPVNIRKAAPARRRKVGVDVQLEAWRWAQSKLAEDGSLPSGRDIGLMYGRHERWGRMVKRSGLAGELGL